MRLQYFLTIFKISGNHKNVRNRDIFSHFLHKIMIFGNFTCANNAKNAIIGTCNSIRYFLLVEKWHFSQLIACDKFAKNARKLSNAKIIAHA